MQQFFDRDAVELRKRAEIRRAGVGRAVLPLADRLTTDAERLSDELLRHLFFRSMCFERLAERAADSLLLLAHVFGLDVIYTFVDVEPVNFNRGYYTVDMHFFYRITLQALNGSTRYTEIEGLATFDKRVVLFGSESGAKIYSSIPEANAIDAPLNLTANLPTAVVEVVDPMLLCAHFADNCNCRCGCDRGTLGGVPAGILAAFDEPIIFDESAIRRVCISLGQFSTVRLERDTQLLIPVYDYCIPSNECTLAGGDCSCEDPCKVFDAVEFPMDDFFPPAAAPGGCGCACPCGEQ